MGSRGPLDGIDGQKILPTPYETTYGEHLVGKSFNPGGHEQVDEIKRMAAEMIDYVLKHGRDTRCTRVAMAEIEDAAMWAVKSVTKQPRI